MPEVDIAIDRMERGEEIFQSIGQPIVDEAFADLFASKIPSPTANRILRRFSRRWRDYTRPALMVMACEAVGGDPKLVHPAAKGLVLAGGAFDLHDDIIDCSFIRKTTKKKSIQGIYGTNATLLIGDALLIGGLTQLTSMPGLSDHVVKKVVKVISDGLFELGAAELEEMDFVRNLDSTPRSYLRVVRMKGADMESYTRLGAMVGGGKQKEVEALGRFGRLLGIICIVRDDLEDTFNDSAECRSRLTKESLPLPVQYCLGDERCRDLLRDIWLRPDMAIDASDLRRLIRIIDDHQGFEKGQRLINGYVRAAKREVQILKDPRPFERMFHS
jgi:geranylgeranyl pyrophosphate synthase